MKTSKIGDLWLIRVLSKGVWILGFLPQLLDLAATYVPANLVPAQILEIIEAGVSWNVTVVLVSAGLLVSAYLVNRETMKKLTELVSDQASLELAVSDVVFIHSEPVLTFAGRFVDGINPDGLPVEAIVGAQITVENIGREEGELEWEVDLGASDLPEVFYLVSGEENGTMSALPDRIPARKLVRTPWRLVCGVSEEKPTNFATALHDLSGFRFVIRYRTLRVGGPTDHAQLVIDGSLAPYREMLSERWTSRGMNDLVALARGDAPA